MSGRKEDDGAESAKYDNSNMKLSTNLSIGNSWTYGGSAHKREMFQSGFKEVGPCSPHLFSNQKKSLVRSGHSPFLPYRSPESIISRFLTDRPADVFDMFDYKRPHYDNILSAFGGFGDTAYTDQRTERRLTFRKEHEDQPVASFVFSSPNKKGRETSGDLRAVNSNQPGRVMMPLRTPDKEMNHQYMKHIESTAMDTSERRNQSKGSDYYYQKPYRMNLDGGYSLGDYGDLRESLKVSKGLKTLSQRVKEIVSEKRKTTYKEVASLLIDETKSIVDVLSAREEQNIKRRVYDALNVLIASDVLIKDNKSVYYKSFYESQMKNKNKQKYLAASKAGSELANKRNHLAKILAARQQATHRKKAILQALLVKVFAMDEILRRNKDQPDPKEKFVSFPFIMVSAAASEDNNITLNMSKGNKQLLVQNLDVVNLLEVSRFSLPAFCEMIQQRFGKKGLEILQALGNEFLRKSFK